MMPFVAIDQDRVGEAELADRGGDLRDLRFGMRAGVAGVRDQRRDRAMVDREVGRRLEPRDPRTVRDHARLPFAVRNHDLIELIRLRDRSERARDATIDSTREPPP